MEPKITASFDLDSEGNPEVINEGDRNHYKIRLQVQEAPDDAYAVTYRLHNSYYNPIRESVAKDSAFEESLTSYGNYAVKAEVRTKQGTFRVSRDLTEALKSKYQDSLSGAVAAAIEELSKR